MLMDGDGLTFRLLGAVTICGRDGQSVEIPASKQRVLLISLLLRPNEWIPSSRLIDNLWGEEPPKSAVGNLKTYIWRLRVILKEITGNSRVQSRPGSYRLAVTPGELDTTLFEELVRQGQHALAGGQPELAAKSFSGALTLWRSEPFDDAPAALVESHLVQLREWFYSAQEQLVEAHLALGQPERAIPMLRAMLAEQPLRERLWAQLISALIQLGRRAEAVAAYQEVYRLLDRELGLEPGIGIKAAYLSALGG